VITSEQITLSHETNVNLIHCSVNVGQRKKEKDTQTNTYRRGDKIVIRRNCNTYIFRKRIFCFTGILQTPYYIPQPKIHIYLLRLFQFGWVFHPIYSDAGDYPPIMKEWVAKKSKEEGYSRSRMPSFTKEEIEMVKGEFQSRETSDTTSRREIY